MAYDELQKNPDLVYVEAIVFFDVDGKITPLKIRWETGEVFIIDKVKDVRTAASRKGGGAATRYTVVINGQETYLFRSTTAGAHGCGRWYVEAKR